MASVDSTCNYIGFAEPSYGVMQNTILMALSRETLQRDNNAKA